MTNIGYATMQVIPSIKGLQKTITAEFGAAGQVASRAMSRSMDGGRTGRTFGSGIKTGILQGIGQGLVRGVGGAVRSVGGVIKSGLSGGITRALNIEGAKASLAGLGHSTKAVTDIMGDALKSVKGTAFGMGDAAAVAASAVAAGIKPGMDLQRTLKLVGDAATIAKTDMGSMGSIFNKVAASNKMQMDVVNQLQDRGIPILQMLAKVTGKSTEEVAKMASAGKINFATFQKAMEQGLGGAALKSGDTFTGALANMKAALSRVVERFATPAMNSLRQVMTGLTPTIDSLGDAVGPVADKFAKWADKATPKLVAGLKKIPGLIDGVKGAFSILTKGDFAGAKATFGWEEDSPQVAALFKFREIVSGAFESAKSAVSGFVEGFGGFDSILETLRGILPLVSGPLGALRAAFAGVGQTDLAGLGRMLGQNLKPVLDTIASLGTSLFGSVMKLMPTIISLVQRLLPIVGRLIQSLGGAVEKILPPLADLLGDLVGLVGDSLVKALTDLEPAIVASFAFLGETIEGVTTTLSGLIEFVEGAFAGDWDKAFGGLQKIAEGWWQQIAALPKAIMSEVMRQVGIEEDFDSLMGRGWTRLQQIMGEWWSDLTGWFSRTWSQITGFVSAPFIAAATAAKPMIDGILKWVEWGKRTFGVAWATIRTLIMIPIELAKRGLSAAWTFITTRIFQPAWTWISGIFLAGWRRLTGWLSEPVNTAKTGLQTAWNTITGAFSGAWSWVQNTFKANWDKLSGWLTAPFSGAKSTIETVWSGIKDVIKAPLRWAIDRINGFLGVIRDVGSKLNISGLPGDIAYPPGFAAGGWTGPGPRSKPAGIVHADEYVISKPARRRFERRHPGALDHINLYGELPGLAGGGLVPDPGRTTTQVWRPVPGGWTTYAGHRGIDFPVPAGTGVRAWRSGRVITASPIGTWGNYMRVDHGGGIWTGYAHLRRFLAGVGDIVRGGQTIALSGGVPGEPGAGNTTGPHLHWEVYKGGSRVFPAPYLSGAVAASAPVPGMGRGTGSDGFIGDVAKGLLEPLLKPFLSLTAPGGIIGQLVAGVPGFLARKAIDGAASIFKFDDGGYLQPGLSLAYNATRRPEPVLTGRQWDQLDRGVTPEDIRAALDGMRVDLDNGRLWFDRHASARERQAGLAVRTA